MCDMHVSYLLFQACVLLCLWLILPYTWIAIYLGIMLKCQVGPLRMRAQPTLLRGPSVVLSFALGVALLGHGGDGGGVCRRGLLQVCGP